MEQAANKGVAEKKAFRLPLKGVLVGGSIGALLFFALLAVAAVFLPSAGIRQAWLPYLGMAMAGLSAFVAAFVAARGKGEKGLLIGLGCALVEAVLLGTVIALLTGGLATATVFLVAALLGCGGAGGIFGVNRQ
ncbi:MAG: TIGR04086 family membrane protein [Oscillospiraceae bacterium]|jgi:putative membrane protein (TIGR04086 family)|nr:TIGR04086 family membrane protein [Oscillospiraceae bacterium]